MALKLLLPSPAPVLPQATRLRRRRPFAATITTFFSLPNSSGSSISMSQSPAPIFLPLLEESQPDQDDLEDDDEELVDGDVESDGDGDDDDPILRFFKSRTDIRDPRREAGLRLQKNRRTSWRIAETVGAGELGDGESEVEPFPASITSSGGVEREGIVGEILAIARGLPQNTTLGEVMDPYSGRVGEKECLEVLGVMGDEGWGFHCLYLLEWMGCRSRHW